MRENNPAALLKLTLKAIYCQEDGSLAVLAARLIALPLDRTTRARHHPRAMLAGLAAARSRGRKGGRKKSITKGQKLEAKRLSEAGELSITDISSLSQNSILDSSCETSETAIFSPSIR